LTSESKGISPGPNTQTGADRPELGTHDTAAVLIYTTFPSADEAKKAGRVLVERHLAACVNVFPPITAVYEWEGNVEEGVEAAMIVKTTNARSAEALDEIKRLHPYSVPARVVLPVIGGGTDFLSWIAEQCSVGADDRG
jgi:periplasmic divalent cation tolerance protein